MSRTPRPAAYSRSARHSRSNRTWFASASSPACAAHDPVQYGWEATNASTSSRETAASGSASSPSQQAKADAARYGEPVSSGGPSGRIDHHDWPASASQSTNRYAASSRRPLGSDVRCRRIPLERWRRTRRCDTRRPAKESSGARRRRVRAVRILLVSQMYPGPDDPDLGVFVRDLADALERRGHELERAVLDSRAGGKGRYATLFRRARAAAHAFRPDVVWAHFLVPSGLAATLSSDAPLVVTAHGRDARNVGAIPGIAAATRFVIRRSAAVIAVSDYLRRELEGKIPEARGRTQVVDSGVDLDRFRVEPAPDGPPAFLCIGGLTERKNVLRLARAFAPLDDGTLTFAGEGPLRAELARFPRVRLLGAVPHERIPTLIRESRVVCGPSLIEPFGQALLEALACGRSVVATRIGGPPEFVTPEAGVLVDPADEGAIARALRTAVALPAPNPAARATAEAHDVNRQAQRVEEILRRVARDPHAYPRRAAARAPRAPPPARPRAPPRRSRAPSPGRRPASAGCPR